MERLAVLGSTGSIGKSTLDVVRAHPDKLKVDVLAAGSNVAEMVSQINEFQPQLAVLATKEACEEVCQCLSLGSPTRVAWGEEELLEAVCCPDVTYVVAAISGSKGLSSTLAAIRAGKKLGLANKESLVCAGHLVLSSAKENGVEIIPIDSEHSAIFQAINGEKKESIKRLVLTASGGAFRGWSNEQLQSVTVEQALKHPTWSMGPKITIDSATLMNKSLEVIEASLLFGIPYDSIDVILHPQSIVHSIVEFIDNSFLAQFSNPDMRLPIQYALSYPERWSFEEPTFDLAALSSLDFETADPELHPALKLAFFAGRTGGSMPTVLNAANEAAVQLFMNKQISFVEIIPTIERVLDNHVADIITSPTLSEIIMIEDWTHTFCRQLVGDRV